MKDWKREYITKRKKEIVIHMDYLIKFHPQDITIFQRARILYCDKLNLDKEIMDKNSLKEIQAGGLSDSWGEAERIISKDVQGLMLQKYNWNMAEGGTIT